MKTKNIKPTVEEFKKQHPEYFKRDSEAQEAVEDISNWSSIFKDPSQEAIDKSWQIQEALLYFPEGRIKSILEDYYYNQLTIQEITDKYEIKNTKNTSVVIYKAKKRVLAHYIKHKKTPIDSTKYVAIKIKVLKYKNKVSYCIKVGKADLSVDPFWVDSRLIRLDDDIQDLLEYSDKYSNDYLEIGEDGE